MKTGFFFEVQTLYPTDAPVNEEIAKGAAKAITLMLGGYGVVGITAHCSTGHIDVVDANLWKRLHKEAGELLSG